MTKRAPLPAPPISVPFTVFSGEADADGRHAIVRSGTCSKRSSLALQALNPGDIVIEGQYADDRYIIEIGEFGPVAVPWTAPAAPIVPDQVKAECERRILARYPLGKQLTLMDEGGPAAEDMRVFRDAMRDAAHRIEAMTPIPPDYREDGHWPSNSGEDDLAERETLTEQGDYPNG